MRPTSPTKRPLALGRPFLLAGSLTIVPLLLLLLLLLPLLLAANSGRLVQAELLLDQQEPTAANSLRPQASLMSADKRGQLLRLFPGLLDETLLTSGSFSFGAKLVKFDKLKVLGNVYVQRINGRPLREAYLLKSTIGGGGGGSAGAKQPASEEVRLRIVH